MGFEEIRRRMRDMLQFLCFFCFVGFSDLMLCGWAGLGPVKCVHVGPQEELGPSIYRLDLFKPSPARPRI